MSADAPDNDLCQRSGDTIIDYGQWLSFYRLS